MSSIKRHACAGDRGWEDTTMLETILLQRILPGVKQRVDSCNVMRLGVK